MAIGDLKNGLIPADGGSGFNGAASISGGGFSQDNLQDQELAVGRISSRQHLGW